MYIYTYTYTYTYIYTDTYVSIYLSFYLSTHLSIYLSICLSIYPSIYLCMYIERVSRHKLPSTCSETPMTLETLMTLETPISLETPVTLEALMTLETPTTGEVSENSLSEADGRSLNLWATMRCRNLTLGIISCRPQLAIDNFRDHVGPQSTRCYLTECIFN